MKYEQDERTSIQGFNKTLNQTCCSVVHAILQLEGLYEVGVQDHAAVGHVQVPNVLPQGVHLLIPEQINNLRTFKLVANDFAMHSLKTFYL